MIRRLALLASLIAGVGSVASAQVVEVPVIERGAISGKPQQIASFVEVNADCSESGLPAIHVSQPPVHGRVQALPSLENPGYPVGTQQYACNVRKLPTLALFYVSERDFQGNDALTVSVIYPDGARRVFRYALTVEAATPVTMPAHPGNWVHV